MVGFCLRKRRPGVVRARGDGFDWVSVALVNFGGILCRGVAVAKSAGGRALRMHAKQCLVQKLLFLLQCWCPGLAVAGEEADM